LYQLAETAKSLCEGFWLLECCAQFPVCQSLHGRSVSHPGERGILNHKGMVWVVLQNLRNLVMEIAPPFSWRNICYGPPCVNGRRLMEAKADAECWADALVL
jgi:hypothetical protein